MTGRGEAHYDFIVVGSGSAAASRRCGSSRRAIACWCSRRAGASARGLPEDQLGPRDWMWMPALGMRGIFQMTFLAPRHHPARRRRRRRLAGLREHAADAEATTSSRAPSWAPPRRLGAGARAPLRDRAPDARRRRTNPRRHPRRPGARADRARHGPRGAPPPDRRGRLLRRARARRCPTRTSAARARRAPAAPSAARA